MRSDKILERERGLVIGSLLWSDLLKRRRLKCDFEGSTVRRRCSVKRLTSGTMSNYIIINLFDVNYYYYNYNYFVLGSPKL